VPHCLKHRYQNRWAAEKALEALQKTRDPLSQRAERGSYWCSQCGSWHLTSKAKSRTPSWYQRKNRPTA